MLLREKPKEFDKIHRRIPTYPPSCWVLQQQAGLSSCRRSQAQRLAFAWTAGYHSLGFASWQNHARSCAIHRNSSKKSGLFPPAISDNKWLFNAFYICFKLIQPVVCVASCRRQLRHNADHQALMILRAREWVPVVFDGLGNNPHASLMDCATAICAFMSEYLWPDESQLV